MLTIILLSHGRAICPACEGAAQAEDDPMVFRCKDCGARYRVIDRGFTDRDLEVKRL